MAEDAGAEAATIGGTLPYMAPEQIRAFQGEKTRVDARADVFALGIILFELLTGRGPWDHLHKNGLPSAPVTDALIDQVYRQRLRPARTVRQYNRDASPALDAIIRHCLESDPARRYQSARQLQEDVQCQLESRPLKHLREPSLRERVQKRLRRSPRLLGRVAAVTAVVLLAAALWFGLHAHNLNQQQQAADNYAAFRKDLPTVQFNLNVRDDQKRLDEGRALGEKTLKRYQVLTNPIWRTTPAFTLLSDEQRPRLEKDIGDLLLLLVLSDLRQRGPQAGPLPPEDFARLLAWNEEAGRCLSPEHPSPAALFQRAALYECQGDADRAKQLRDQATGLPLATAPDCCARGRDLIGQGQVKKALPLLQQASRLDPQHYWTHFLLGICQDELGNDHDAAAAYSVCVALDPQFFGAWFNRGLAHLRDKKYAPAADDFSRVIELYPELPKTYINRALAFNNLGFELERGKNLKQARAKFLQALDDLTRAVDKGTTETRVYFLRANVKQKLGDQAGAQQDQAEGMKRTPSDEASWVARGRAQAATNPLAALHDFDQALKLNPSYRPGWNNKAAVYDGSLQKPLRQALQTLDRVLAVHPGDPAALASRTLLLGQLHTYHQEAVKCLDHIAQLYPDHAPTFAGRGVLHARVGKWDLARKDAQAALALDRSSEMLYQVGCIYALTSRQKPEDRGPALKLIGDALRQGYGAQLLATDSDLDPLRHLPEFKKLLTAATALK
jgi:tetratricopeptide (TPR) repeat protein